MPLIYPVKVVGLWSTPNRSRPSLTSGTDSLNHQGRNPGPLDPPPVLFVEQITQAEIDAGAVQLAAVVNATDPQEKETLGRGAHTVVLDSVSALVLGEIVN